MKKILAIYDNMANKLKKAEFIIPLALRIYLAPIFIIAGLNKLNGFNDTVEWFGNAEWGLGLPFPTLMVLLVILAELIGGFALLLGVFTRLFSLLLMITMAVAAFKVHLTNGWFAIASSDGETSIASFWASLGFESAKQSLNNSAEVAERLTKAREILEEHGNYEWLTELGNFVILNNGVEFSVTYLIMLLPLFFYGAGNYISIDYFLKKWIKR